jgi:8-oxo-dGTP diphosphatase
VGKFLFVHEFLEAPLHAVELFFQVQIIGGTLKKGIDPELAHDAQIIDELRWFSREEIEAQPADIFHNALHSAHFLGAGTPSRPYLLFRPSG